MKTGHYEVTVRLPDGSKRTAKIVADSLEDAKRMARKHGRKVIRTKVIRRAR